jgi:hypothetical protein
MLAQVDHTSSVLTKISPARSTKSGQLAEPGASGSPGVHHFPEAWERFRNGVPPEDRNGDLLAAYARPMRYPKRIAGRQQPKAAIADRM